MACIYRCEAVCSEFLEGQLARNKMTAGCHSRKCIHCRGTESNVNNCCKWVKPMEKWRQKEGSFSYSSTRSGLCFDSFQLYERDTTLTRQCACVPTIADGKLGTDTDTSDICQNVDSCTDKKSNYRYRGKACFIDRQSQTDTVTNRLCQSQDSPTDQTDEYMWQNNPGFTHQYCQTEIVETYIWDSIQEICSCHDQVNAHFCQCECDSTDLLSESDFDVSVDLGEEESENSFCKCERASMDQQCQTDLDVEDKPACQYKHQAVCQCHSQCADLLFGTDVDGCDGGAGQDRCSCIDQLNGNPCECPLAYQDLQKQTGVNNDRKSGSAERDAAENSWCMCPSSTLDILCSIGFEQSSSAPYLSGSLVVTDFYSCKCYGSWTCGVHLPEPADLNLNFTLLPDCSKAKQSQNQRDRFPQSFDGYCHCHRDLERTEQTLASDRCDVTYRHSTPGSLALPIGLALVALNFLWLEPRSQVAYRIGSCCSCRNISPPLRSHLSCAADPRFSARHAFPTPPTASGGSARPHGCEVQPVDIIGLAITSERLQKCSCQGSYHL